MEEKETFHNPKDYCQVWRTLSVRCISTLSLLCFERTFQMNINQQKTGNMEKGFQRQVTPEQMEKIKAQVIRLSNLEEACQQTMQLIKEILDATNSTINIDAIDIRDILDGDGMLAAFDASVSATNTERMKDLVEQIESKIASVTPVKSMLFHLFFPEGLPLQMSELQPLSDWLSSFQPDSDLKVKWGLSVTMQSSEPHLRAIMLAVT